MQCKIIRGGFSFCGVDIARLGLEYAPEKEDTYVYAPAATKIFDETFDGHNGGYLYGSSKEPKEFTLRCVFEEQNIARSLMARVHDLFRGGRSGKLIFSRRPWAYYYATVSETPTLELSNYLNGLVTIKMKAYYPFARSEGLVDDPLSPFYNELTDPCHGEVMLNTGLFDMKKYIPQMSFTDLTEEKTFVLSNPGTEYAPVGIICAGDAPDGVIITNNTTGQSCKFVALSKARTSDIDKHVYLDGISGKTILTNDSGTEKSLAFLFHDYGFIHLEPCYPVLRNVFINYNSGSVIYTTNILDCNYVGKYLFVYNDWYKITSQPDENTLVIAGDIQTAGSETSMIAPMNEITVKPVTTMDITRLSFVYKPTFS